MKAGMAQRYRQQLVSATGVLLVVACCMGTLHGATPDFIAGPLPRVVRNTGRPYVVEADIEVPAGRMVTIEPGVVFLFKNFTGLHVQGRLVAEGTRSDPIVFTSVLDRKHNPASSMVPNPYDWNGLYLHSDALGSVMDHVEVSYTVYGLVSETKFIRIRNGLFRENGKGDVEIENVRYETSNGAFEYVLSTKDATVDGIPVKLLRDPMAPRRTVTRVVAAMAFAGGGALGVWQAVELQDARGELNALSSTTFENLHRGSNEEWHAARSNRNQRYGATVAGFALGLAGSAGFIWSFTF